MLVVLWRCAVATAQGRKNESSLGPATLAMIIFSSQKKDATVTKIDRKDFGWPIEQGSKSFQRFDVVWISFKIQEDLSV